MAVTRSPKMDYPTPGKPKKKGKGASVATIRTYHVFTVRVDYLCMEELSDDALLDAIRRCPPERIPLLLVAATSDIALEAWRQRHYAFLGQYEKTEASSASAVASPRVVYVRDYLPDSKGKAREHVAATSTAAAASTSAEGAARPFLTSLALVAGALKLKEAQETQAIEGIGERFKRHCNQNASSITRAFACGLNKIPNGKWGRELGGEDLARVREYMEREALACLVFQYKASISLNELIEFKPDDTLHPPFDGHFLNHATVREILPSPSDWMIVARPHVGGGLHRPAGESSSLPEQSSSSTAEVLVSGAVRRMKREGRSSEEREQYVATFSESFTRIQSVLQQRNQPPQERGRESPLSIGGSLPPPVEMREGRSFSLDSYRPRASISPASTTPTISSAPPPPVEHDTATSGMLPMPSMSIAGGCDSGIQLTPQTASSLTTPSPKPKPA